MKLVGGGVAGIALSSLASALPPDAPGAPIVAGAAGSYSTGAPGEMKNGDATIVKWKPWRMPTWTGVTGTVVDGSTSSRVNGTNAAKIKGTATMADACSVLDIGTGAYVDCDFVIAFEAIECYPVGMGGWLQTPDGNVCFIIDHIQGGAGGEDGSKGQFCPYSCTTHQIKDCKVTYKFVRKDTGEAIPPNRFSYWFSSMNPGEGVAVDPADGCTVAKTVVTSDGLRNYPDLMSHQKPDDRSKQFSYMGSSSLVDQSAGGVTKYVGGPWLIVTIDGHDRAVDVADLGQDLRFPSGDLALGPNDVKRDGQSIVYGSHRWDRATVECWRAVALEIEGEEGATLHYYQDRNMMYVADCNYYWVPSFLATLDTPAPPPAKSVVAAEGELEHVQPGERVDYTVSSNCVVISKDRAPSKVTFVDHMPMEVNYKNAVMKLNDEDVTESLGHLSYDYVNSGPTQSGRKDLTWEMDMAAFKAHYADDDFPMVCTFSWEIEGRVVSHCEAGLTITNVATCTVDDEEEECECSFETDVPVLEVTKTVI